MRLDNRLNDQLRNIHITRDYIKEAEGSVLIEFGNTKVVCTASFIVGVPFFLKNSGKGWLTAEYGMLPRSTHERMQREATRGKQGGRTLEIQRLISRSLRAAINLNEIGENTIIIDCDVIQADGGTRTASITGGCLALCIALQNLQNKNKIITNPFRQFIASVSVGIHQNEILLDLDYAEDSAADTDMNVVMTEHDSFIEVQGTAEKQPFAQADLDHMLTFARNGIKELIQIQKSILNL